MADRSIAEVLESLATPGQAPAGGTAAALAGSLGASLCEMVCSNVQQSPDAPAELGVVGEDLVELRTRLTTLATADAGVIEDVAETGLGAVAEEATRVPLEIAEAAAAVVEHAATVAEAASGPVSVDAAVGAMLAHAALETAVFIATRNVALIDEPAVEESIRFRLGQLEGTADASVARAKAAAS